MMRGRQSYSIAAVGLLAGYMSAMLPSLAGGQDMIVYKPDVIGVDRLFLVALKVPTETAAVTIQVPECVTLLDRTPLPTAKEIRKYYFRSNAPATKAEIVFAGSIPEQRVIIDVWSFDDLREYRELKGVQLPRRWPLHEELPELKAGQTLTSDAFKQHMEGRGGPQHYLDMSDEAIWSLQPDSTIPRWHWTNVNYGCPEHGKQIYKKKPFYPWLNERGKVLRSYTAGVPYVWKIQCPAGKELYPSNDFASDDFTSGLFPDDGIGGACEVGGKKFGFIAEICQSYCHQMLAVAPACADGYLATGDIGYVHKALVAMSRLAVEYTYLATMTQHRHRNSRSQVDRLGPAPFSEGPCLTGSGFTVYCIDQPGYQWRMAEAYDRIWPAIDQDPEIVPFLKSKGIEVASNEDVRRFLEENLMAVWMQGAMDGSTRSNEPYAQRGLIRMAEMLNYSRGNEFMDWLYDGDGNMRIFATNSFFRDGAPYESSGGYNGMHVVAFGPIVESVEHLRQLRTELYPEEKYPNLSKSRRYHNVFDFTMNTVNIDRTYPRVGDDGSPPNYMQKGVIRWQNGGTAAFEHAYSIFRDPKFAWALANTKSWRPSLEFPFTRGEIEQAARQWPGNWNDASRLSDGYGLAMLRSGSGRNKRALWMMYGRAKGHVHDDLFHIGFDAFQSEILGHLGYPRNWNHWCKNWITQILARQVPFVSMTAAAQLFCDAGPVHLAEAKGEAFTDGIGNGTPYTIDSGNGQRRMLALIDVDDERFYCLDLYRIWGGNECWWTFHCQEDEGFVTTGLDLIDQKEGTLAGEDVPYGDDTWLQANGCKRSNYGWSGTMFGFPHLYNVQRGETAGPWSAEWTLKGGKGLKFRIHSIPEEPLKVAVCDGTSPAGGKPYEMKWLLLHNEGQPPLETGIAAFMELYRGNPVIRRVDRMRFSDAEEDTHKAVAYRVDVGDRIDYLFASADPNVVRHTDEGFTFAGHFGMYSECSGEPEHIVLVGGTLLKKGNVGVEVPQAEMRLSIAAVDYNARKIILDGVIEQPDRLVGSIVFVSNDERRLGLEVERAENRSGKTVLTMAFSPRVGIGRVTGTADGKILTDTKFYVRGHRYYHGARIANEDGTAEFSVEGVASHAFVLLKQDNAQTVPENQLAEAFAVGSWFSIYDYGVGDAVSIPTVVSVSMK